MSSFSFPPPPPPPPPTASSSDQSHQAMNNVRGGRGGGQNRGRGRGRGNDFRGGRGGGPTRGGYNRTNGSSNSNYHGSGYSTGGEGSYNTQTPMTGVPPNTQYGYPYAPFVQQPQQQQVFQSPQDQQAALANLAAALPQYNQLFSALGAMAHVQARQGVQVPQYPSQNLPAAMPPVQYNIPSTNQHNFQNSYSNSPRNDFRNQYSGNKRKRDDLQNRPPSSGRHSDGQKPEVAPSVPSFGFSLPEPPAPASSDITNQQKKKKKKRTHNQLGLTPRGEDHESSEEEIDEEAAFATSGGALVFTHGRQTTALGSKAEIEAWIAERKAKYPTQARVAEKKRQETLKLIEKQENQRKVREEEKSKTRNKDKRDKAAKAQQKADKLRAKLQKLEAKAARAAGGLERSKEAVPNDASSEHDTTGGAQNTRVATATTAHVLPKKPSLGLAYESSAASDDDDSDISSSSEDPSSESSHSDSEDDSDSSDSDSVPETATATRQAPDKVAPPPRNRVPPGYCVKWVRSGHCPHGRKCRWKHQYPDDWKGTRKAMERKVERSAKPVEKKRVKLYDRLVQQELEAEDRMALQAIKSLGSRGFLG